MQPVVLARKAILCPARRTLVSSMILATVLGSGCATTGGGDPLASYNSAFERGDYAAAAASLSSEDASEQGSTERDVLRVLHKAEAQRLSGDYRGAIDSYRLAESGLKSIDTEGVGERAAEGAASFVGVSGDYEPYEAEKVLINTYLALSYLSLGEDDKAGLEFRRASDRSENALDAFESELAEMRASKIEIGDRSIGLEDVAQKVMGAESGAEDWANAGVDTFEGYDEFMVPAANYLYGVYSMGLRDPSDADKAEFALRSVAESQPEVELFQREFEEAERGRAPTGSKVWIVYENGRAPALVEDAKMVDVTVDTDNLDFGVRGSDVDRSAWQDEVQAKGLSPYVLAYAVPTSSEAVEAGALQVRDSAGTDYPLERFSQMGSVRKTEFDRRLPAMQRRAMSEAAIKVAAQAVAAKKVEGKAAGFGGFAARIAGNASAATTSADTRSWSSLPSHWEVARLQRPGDGALSLDGTRVELPSWKRTLVYVKRPAPNSPLRASIIDLDGQNEAKEVGL